MGQSESKTVLVIEDDKISADVMTTILEAGHFAAVVARDGREALEMMERELPDLVVLDLRMPVMDGWEFARRCRERYGSAVPIVVCTAHSSRFRGVDDIRADGWLEKPFDIDDFIALVRRVSGITSS